MTTLSQHFERLASKFRQIEADTAEDGELYVQRVAAEAMDRLAEEMDRLGEEWKSGWFRRELPRCSITKEPDQKYNCWLFVASELQRLCGDHTAGFYRQGDDPGADYSDWPESFHDAVSFYSPQDWKQRRLEFARACEMLAEMAESPTPPSDNDDPEFGSPPNVGATGFADEDQVETENPLLDETDQAVLAIAGNSKLSLDERGRRILSISNDAHAWDSVKWGRVLKCTDGRVRQLSFWKTLQEKKNKPD
jgi:hypothetical protein